VSFAGILVKIVRKNVFEHSASADIRREFTQVLLEN